MLGLLKNPAPPIFCEHEVLIGKNQLTDKMINELFCFSCNSITCKICYNFKSVQSLFSLIIFSCGHNCYFCFLKIYGMTIF